MAAAAYHFSNTDYSLAVWSTPLAGYGSSLAGNQDLLAEAAVLPSESDPISPTHTNIPRDTPHDWSVLMPDTKIEMIELSDDELDLIAAGGGETNQANQMGRVNVNVQGNNVIINDQDSLANIDAQGNNVAILSAGFIQAT
jgi:hypothetical protein